MAARRRVSLLLLAAAALSSALPAAEETAPPAPTRALSPALAQALTASLPAYRPPAKQTAAGDNDTEDIDNPYLNRPKPKNGIVRLPRVVVEGKRPPVFREQDIHTAKGLADLAVKRYFNETGLILNRFTLPLVGIGKEAYALMLWRQDERLRLIREFGMEADWSEAFGEPARASALRDLINDTFGHSATYFNPGQASLRDARGQ